MNCQSNMFKYLVYSLMVCTPLFYVHASADATVTAKGYAYCYDGTNQAYYPMEGVRVELMDSDCDGSQICDEEMGRNYVQADGSFTVTGSGGDPWGIGSDPDVYLRFAYNDDHGVRLTDELDTTRSWNTPEHDHNNTGDGTIDFGSWSTGNGVSSGEGTKCGVWQKGRIAFQSYIKEFGAEPPAGHLDIEYWSAIWTGTPWTNTDTIHWPIHYRSDALPHEFGHSIRHAADGNGSHFSYDVGRFQYARTHNNMCASDGNRNPSESDESLRGFAFNEGWAEYWAGAFGGCGTTNRDVEGNIAHILSALQTLNGLKRTDMVSVLTSNPGSIHSIDEFIAALQNSHVGIKTSALTQDSTVQKAINYIPYTEAQRKSLITSQINQIEKRISDLRQQALAYQPTSGNSESKPCKNCEDVFNRIVAPALFQSEAKVLEIRVTALKRAATLDWAQQVQRELNAGRYNAFIENYRSELRGAMRDVFLGSIRSAESRLREVRSQMSPAAFDASLSELVKARGRLARGTSNSTDFPLGWLPQISLVEDQARFARKGGQLSSDANPKSISKTSLSVPANAGWVATGIFLSRGQHLNITAQGIWSNSGPPANGAKGFENYKYPGTVLKDADLASLIGKVGDSMFAVGESFDGTSPASGQLYLSINDTPDSFGDNQGALSVKLAKY